MKMRWLAAGLAAVLITGGGATVAQRIITQKTRGVLPEKDDAAHADSRTAVVAHPPANDPKVVPAGSRVDPPRIAQAATTVEGSLPTIGVESPPTLPPDQPIIATSGIAAETPAPEPAPSSAGDVAAPAPPLVPAPTDAAILPVTAPEPEAPAVTRRRSRPPQRSVPVAVLEPAADPGFPATGTPEVPARVDPVDSVEAFVERNRKEAETAIASLTNEAANLKSRLAKVEAALAKWQTFSRALTADQIVSQPAVVAPARPGWKRNSPDQPADPPISTTIEGHVESTPVVAQPAPSTEVPISPPVLPAGDPLDVPGTDPTPPPGPAPEPAALPTGSPR